MIKTVLIKDSPDKDGIITDAAETSGMIEITQVLKADKINFKALKNINCDLVIIQTASCPVLEEKLMTAVKKNFCNPFVILLSQNNALAVQAIELGLDDYMIAPAPKHRLLLSFRRIHERYLLRQGKQNGSENRYFFIREKNTLNRIEPKDILYVQALGDYIVIKTPEKKYTIHSTIRNMEARLPRSQFIRAHRTYLVNLEKIEKIVDDVIHINSAQLPIGEAYRSELLQQLSILK